MRIIKFEYKDNNTDNNYCNVYIQEEKISFQIMPMYNKEGKDMYALTLMVQNYNGILKTADNKIELENNIKDIVTTINNTRKNDFLEINIS